MAALSSLSSSGTVNSPSAASSHVMAALSSAGPSRLLNIPSTTPLSLGPSDLNLGYPTQTLHHQGLLNGGKGGRRGRKGRGEEKEGEI